MLPDQVSNPGPLTYESGALPIALHGPAVVVTVLLLNIYSKQLLSCWDSQLTYRTNSMYWDR